MMDNKLSGYISIIGNGVIIPIDDYVAPEGDPLIYKLICSFSIPDKKKVSNKFVKKLISKMRMMSPVVKAKTDKNVYIVSQNYNQNNLLVLEYTQGDLKDRFKESDQ